MQGTRKSILDDEHIGRLLFKLSLPAFFGVMVMTLYNVVDTIFVGRFVGPLGIAGLSIVFPLQMLSFGIGQLCGVGGASSISRSIGSGNIERAERVLGNAIFLGACIMSVIMIIGLSNASNWLSLMGSSSTILPYARDYFTIILSGIIFGTLSISLNSMAVAEGNARIAMHGMIIGALSNIVLDALFIIPLNMGIKGVALATILAQLLSASYLLRYYLSGKSYIKFKFKNLKPDLVILKAILVIGIASFATSLTSSFSAILINRAFLFYGGDMAVSAFGILNRIMMFAIMPGMVIGQGLQPILGFNYGAKRYDRALRVLRLSLLSAGGLSLCVFAILYSIPESIISIFTRDKDLLNTSVEFARYTFLALYIIGPAISGSVAFQALGKALQSFITTISRSFLFLIPLVIILPRFLELKGVLLAFPLSDLLTFILTTSLLIPQIMWFRRQKARVSTTVSTQK